MSPNRHRPGFWGTFRSYLVAGAVLSVMAGVLGLIPASLMLMLVQTPGGGETARSWLLLTTSLMFPVLCFAAPVAAYAAYRNGRRRMAVVLLLVPLAAAILFTPLWFQVDEFCGGRLLC